MATKEAAGPKPISFGTDGWRGQLGRDFTFQNVRTVAQAIADFLNQPKKDMPVKLQFMPDSPIVVAYDRRFRSDAFAKEIAGVLAGNDLKAVLAAEPLPTPALSFLTQKHRTIGVMVTASHNPFDYNGVKIKAEGSAAAPALTSAVEAKLGQRSPAKDGEVPVKSYREAYLSFVKSKAPLAKIAAGLKKPVVLDLMFGSGAGFLEELLPAKKLVTLHDRHDPLFGGLHPEPIEKYLGELSAAVKANKASVGLALDGDADRLGVVDDQGRYLTPCQVFPLLLEYLIGVRKITGKVVQSVSLGFLSQRIAKAHQLEFEEVPVGFKHIAEKLRSGEAAFGGEESGGYAWKGCLPERDGIVAALLFLEMLAVTKQSPSQLLAAVEKKYGKSVFKRVDFTAHKTIDKASFVEKVQKRIPTKLPGMKVAEVKAIDGIKVIFENGHWVLMRPSGTEPLVRTYAETDSAKGTDALLEQAQKWLRGYL